MNVILYTTTGTIRAFFHSSGMNPYFNELLKMIVEGDAKALSHLFTKKKKKTDGIPSSGLLFGFKGFFYLYLIEHYILVKFVILCELYLSVVLSKLF